MLTTVAVPESAEKFSESVHRPRALARKAAGNPTGMSARFVWTTNMKKIVLGVTVLALPLALTGCPNPNGTATISYHQTGACNGGQGQSGDPSTFYNAGPNQAFVVFGIERIDNSAGSVTFNFDPTKLFVNSTTRDFVDPSLMIYKWVLGPFASVPQSIAAGSNVGFAVSGQNALVVQTTNPNGSVEANMTSYFLLYNTGPSDPGVVMNKTDASQTTWPNTENCAAISLH